MAVISTFSSNGFFLRVISGMFVMQK